MYKTMFCVDNLFIVPIQGVGVVVFFIRLMNQLIGDYIPYLVVFVTLILPMLIILLCINIHGF